MMRFPWRDNVDYIQWSGSRSGPRSLDRRGIYSMYGVDMASITDLVVYKGCPRMKRPVSFHPELTIRTTLRL